MVAILKNIPYVQQQLETHSKGSAYLMHKRFFQVLQDAKYPNIDHWVLKWPGHNLWLDQLLETYPDANLIVCLTSSLSVLFILAETSLVVHTSNSSRDCALSCTTSSCIPFVSFQAKYPASVRVRKDRQFLYQCGGSTPNGIQEVTSGIGGEPCDRC